MEESSAQNSAISNGDNLDETGIMIRVRPLMDSTFALEQQGTAARRLRLETDVINRLETAIRNASYVGTDSETSTTKDDFGDDASISSNDGIECRASNSEVRGANSTGNSLSQVVSRGHRMKITVFVLQSNCPANQTFYFF